MRKKVVEEALRESYRRAFKAAEPSVNFDTLVENAVVNERGEKEIPFMDYVLDIDVASSILKEVEKEFKLKGLEKRALSINYYLGCSPKHKEI